MDLIKPIMLAAVLGATAAVPVAKPPPAVSAKPYAMRGVELGTTIDAFRAFPIPNDLDMANLSLACTGDDTKLLVRGRHDPATAAGVTNCQWFSKPEPTYPANELFIQLGRGITSPVFQFVDDGTGTKRLARVDFFDNVSEAAGIEEALRRNYGAPRSGTNPFQTRGGVKTTSRVMVWSNGVSSITLVSPCARLDRFCLEYRHAKLGKVYDAIVEKLAGSRGEQGLMAVMTRRSGQTRSRRARTAPVLLRDGKPARLERASLNKGEYTEKWLQDLIHDHPELLAISEIEPAFGVPIPVAREVVCGHGIIDNIFLTPSGEIVLVETKLWRNPQARREVVAQALDYVASLMGMGFDQFEQQVLRAEGGASRRLYDFVAEEADALDEPAFIDAVSRNLARGRLLVLAVGDGIHQEAEALVDLLQSHAGAHFTFALVEVATWRDLDTGDLIAVPDVLAQTVMIERGIVVIKDGAIAIEPVPAKQITTAHTISEAMFYEELAKRDAQSPQRLKAFLAELAPLGIYTELGRTLSIKLDLPNRSKPVSLGYVTRTGQVWTKSVVKTAPDGAGEAYLHALGQRDQRADQSRAAALRHDQREVRALSERSAAGACGRLAASDRSGCRGGTDAA